MARTSRVTIRAPRLRLPALLVALVVISAAPAAAGQRTVLDDVHTDTVHVTWSAGKLRSEVRVGSPGAYRYHDPSDVLFQLKDVSAARRRIPDSSAYRFLGQPGARVWTAPQAQDPSLIFAGWDTEALPNGVFRNDSLRFELVSVSGPGRVEVYQVGTFGSVTRLYSSSDASFKRRDVPARAHVHANWSFTKKGRYVLRWRVSAHRARDGGQVTSRTVTHVWVVGRIKPEWR